MIVTVNKDVVDVSNRLESLGLIYSGIRDAVLYGETFRDASTENDVQFLIGAIAWGKHMRGMRDWLVPIGWARLDVRNVPMIVHPSGEFAITVSSGDENTGNPDRSPKSKNAKGSATEDLVANNKQLTFFYALPMPTPTPNKPMSGRMTWVLLIARINDEVFLELSLPNDMDEDGRVASWKERIILPTISTAQSIQNGIEFEFSEEIDINVVRK